MALSMAYEQASMSIPACTLKLRGANLCRSDNFYALGCNSTDNSAGGSCEKRFQSDWINVYKTKHQPALKPLTWRAER